MSYALAQSTSLLTTAFDAAAQFKDAFLKYVVLSTKRAQVAQLKQAMHRMSDPQLAEIGITRAEIADYVDMLMSLRG